MQENKFGEGKLWLRSACREDASVLLSWLSDERTVALWKADRFSWPLDQRQLETYLQEFTENMGQEAFMAVTGDGRSVGHFSFREIEEERKTAHLGFIVVNPACRGLGYGRSMVKLALEWAFCQKKLDSVWLGVYDCNQAARHCYEALGFTVCSRPGFTEEFHGEIWEYSYLEAHRKKGYYRK